MFDRMFCEVSVSRVSPERFRAEGEAFMEKLGYDRSEGHKYSAYESYVESRYAPGWGCNDTVGWIRLWASYGMIKGEYFWLDKLRLVRLPRAKRFKWGGKALELLFEPGQSEAEVFDAVRDRLVGLSRERPFRRRYIDLLALDSIAPYVRWHDLVFRDGP